MERAADFTAARFLNLYIVGSDLPAIRIIEWSFEYGENTIFSIFRIAAFHWFHLL